ncbi:MAG: hypothetical protein L3K09_00185 [Thermoplasmata archaeon]|nr:hypothetical protein [Thermoplasmata archaeon]
MRGLRSLGLLALFVGAQLVALLLALPFKSAGLASTSNPNNPTDPLFLILIIILAPLVILLLARRAGSMRALRWLILLGIGGSLTITLGAAIGLVTPPPIILSPVGPGLFVDLSVPFATAIAVGLFLALLIEPQWYVVDAAGFVAAGSLIALLGISFGILPVFILLIALAVYDAVAVYGTKHMISLADVVTDMKLPILMVMPGSADFDYTRKGTFTEQRAAPVAEREAMFMGLGDVVFPGILVVSSFVWLPTSHGVGGIGGNLLVAFGSLLGALLGFSALMRLVGGGNPQAGLPLLNGGVIGGYIVSFLIVYHSLGLGLTVSL